VLATAVGAVLDRADEDDAAELVREAKRMVCAYVAALM
jgi:hypothetical protein